MSAITVLYRMTVLNTAVPLEQDKGTKMESADTGALMWKDSAMGLFPLPIFGQKSIITPERPEV